MSIVHSRKPGSQKIVPFVATADTGAPWPISASGVQPFTAFEGHPTCPPDSKEWRAFTRAAERAGLRPSSEWADIGRGIVPPGPSQTAKAEYPSVLVLAVETMMKEGVRLTMMELASHVSSSREQFYRDYPKFRRPQLKQLCKQIQARQLRLDLEQMRETG